MYGIMQCIDLGVGAALCECELETVILVLELGLAPTTAQRRIRGRTLLHTTQLLRAVRAWKQT